MSGGLLAIAFFLDLVLGDPPKIPHPMVGVGKLVAHLETLFAALINNKRLAGIVLTVATLTIAGGLTWLGFIVCHEIHPLVGALYSIYIAYTTLSLHSLHKETFEVIHHLKADNLVEARRALALIVGRSTHDLDRDRIIRACVETLSENTSSTVVAPLFYLWLGGPVAAVLYKTVSTLDSMVGYHTAGFRDLGWASARLDDLLNLIPARLTGLLLVCAAFFLGLNGREAFRILWRDSRKPKSPNAGFPESAAAGALGIQLGGPATYFGDYVEKPVLGDGDAPAEFQHYHLMVRLMYVTSLIGLLLFVFLPTPL